MDHVVRMISKHEDLHVSDSMACKATLAAGAAPSRGGLRSASFLGLLCTQFLGAVNDNTFRLLVVGIGTSKVHPEYSSLVLSVGLACFTLPYILLAAPAGYLADRFRKRQVIVACKVAEIAIMGAGVLAIWTGELYSLFIVLALMGAQSALFGPAKLGSIPEMLRPEKISAANGLMGLCTIVSTVLGVALGNWLFQATGPTGTEHLWLTAAAMVGIAVAGTLTSLLILPLPAGNAQKPFPWNLARESYRDLRALFSNAAMLRVALGVAFFWSLGALAQSNILEYGAEGGLLQHQTNPLLVSLVLGLGTGSVLAGMWSGGKVELGILPLGAAGIMLCALLLYSVSGELVTPAADWTAAHFWACLWLFGMGAAAGMFNVPLESYLQHRSPPATRGSLLAASNFLTFSGILLATGVYAVLRYPAHPPLPDTLPALATLPYEQRQRIESLKKDYAAAWRRAQSARSGAAALESGDIPRLRDFTSRAAEGDRALAIRELGMFDATARRQAGLAAALKLYRADFRERQELEILRTVLSEPAPLLSARQVFLLNGVVMVPILLYILWLLPQATLRFLALLASKTIYQLRVYGLENLPERGPALLTPNHVSWLDGVLLLITSSRRIRMVAHAKYVTGGWLGRLARLFGVIPIDPGKPSVVRQALETVRQALHNGELVCVFPEGSLTRTGELQPFKRGLLNMLGGTSAPVIPVYLDQLWGSIFSWYGGKLFWKWPRQWPYPVRIYFGVPMQDVRDVEQVREAVAALGRSEAERRAGEAYPIPARAFVSNCRRQWNVEKVVDSLGQRATGGQMLMRVLILRRLLLRHVLTEGEKYVGVLLPPSLGAVACNAVLPLMGRISVNLNYTLSKAELDYCLAQCNIQHVLTSRRFLEKFEVPIDPSKLVYLEDFREQVSLFDKLCGAAMARLMPLSLLQRRLGLDRARPDDVLTVIFTSGSTGTPKGVQLTNRNVGSNVRAIQESVHLRPDDVLLGILPFFHSFGYTITMWSVLMLPPKGVYHTSPLDARMVGKLCQQHGVTILMSTPTFLRSYQKRCTKEEFAKLEVVVAGAEKLPKDLMDSFEEKFGIRPVEGYGTTELSPLVSVNIPPTRASGGGVTVREGSVGRCVPGVRAKVVHLETGEDLGTDEEGMLLVTGPNVMAGYLHQPEKTAEVMRGPWYVTGDIARIDADGFIFITGRQSRFSKIGGEMVPHLKVEEVLSGLVSHGEDEIKVAVTAVPCPRKGERLVVLHLPLEKTPEQLCRELAAAGLPNLFIPSPDSFCQVEKIPLLGSGKLDLKGLKDLALQKFSAG